MKEKEFYEHLQNHALFSEQQFLTTHTKFVFKKEDKDVSQHGLLLIPAKEEETLRFIYREMTFSPMEVTSFIDSAKDSLVQLPDGWFKDIINETIDVLYKRDRIRLLLMNKENESL